MNPPKFRYVVCVALVLTAVACNGPDSVTAKKRTSKFKAVMASDEVSDSSEKPNNVNLDFFHPDHFACLTLNVPSVLENKDMSEIGWEQVEEQFAEFVGIENSSLENIERVWVVLDRTALDGMGMNPTSTEQGAGPWVFIVDFKSIPNTAQLKDSMSALLAKNQKEQAKKKEATDDSSTDEDPRGGETELSLFDVKLIGETRVVVGKKDLIAKISGRKQSSELVGILEGRKLDADFEGVLTITPIRSFLKSMFDLVSMVPGAGNNLSQYAVVPDVLEKVDFRLSLDSEEMFEALVYLDDAELNKKIARAVKEISNMDASAFGAMGGRGGMMGQQPSAVDMPVKIASTELMTEVGKEIMDSKLFTVEEDESKVAFRLSRPTKFKELISALIEDGSRQASFLSRMTRFSQIADAMKAYHEKHNSLPPAGVVKPGDESGLPPQFNWRVGLLPFLDQQELYDAFDFESEWDAEANKTVAAKMPEVFGFGIKPTVGDTKTRLQVVGGSIGVYAGDGMAIEDIKDKKIHTALIVEGVEVEWTQPGAMEFSVSEDKLDQSDDLGVKEENAALMVSAAFAVKAIRKTESNLKGVLTTDGEENVNRKSFMKIAR